MRILKWIVGVVVVLGLAFVAGGLVLPREVTVARSIDIEAAPAEVFPYVNSLKEGQKWSPWLARDPNVAVDYSGPDAGVGAVMTWASYQRDVGTGRQEIVASVPGERVETDLDFGPMGTAKAAFLLEETAGGTRVTWDLVADMGSGPVGRWMGLMMDNWVGADYERGLSNLKALAEGA